MSDLPVEELHWHHVHWEHTIAAIVIGDRCFTGPGCGDRSHIAIAPPITPDNVEGLADANR